jgi:hypothetical protein
MQETLTMTLNQWTSVSAGTLAVGLVVGSFAWLAPHRLAAEPAANAKPAEPLTADTFAPLQKQIRPQPDESRWLEVPWLLDLHEARRQAAALGKPLFVYSGGGATGIGAC